jgi:hypothetical protein
MSEKDFIDFVKAHCKLYGVKVRCVNNFHITDTADGSMFSGYFDDENKKIVVARKNINFWGILAHEYCHFTQWSEQCGIWVKADIEKSYYHFADFLNGKEVENINYHIDNLKNVELDNEKRTVELITKLKLPIDINLYIKKANAYIYFYNWIKISKKWSNPKNSAYTNKRLIAAMKENFNQDYSILPPKIEKIFREEKI